jgi:hypothetical protein
VLTLTQSPSPVRRSWSMSIQKACAEHILLLCGRVGRSDLFGHRALEFDQLSRSYFAWLTSTRILSYFLSLPAIAESN